MKNENPLSSYCNFEITPNKHLIVTNAQEVASFGILGLRKRGGSFWNEFFLLGTYTTGGRVITIFIL